MLVVQEIGERASVSERGPLSNPVDVRGRDRASVYEPDIRKRARRQHRVYTEAVPVLLRIRGYKFFFYSLEDREPPHIHVAHAGRYAQFSLDPLNLASNRGFEVTS